MAAEKCRFFFSLAFIPSLCAVRSPLQISPLNSIQVALLWWYTLYLAYNKKCCSFFIFVCLHSTLYIRNAYFYPLLIWSNDTFLASYVVHIWPVCAYVLCVVNRRNQLRWIDIEIRDDKEEINGVCARECCTLSLSIIVQILRIWTEIPMNNTVFWLLSDVGYCCVHPTSRRVTQYRICDNYYCRLTAQKKKGGEGVDAHQTTDDCSREYDIHNWTFPIVSVCSLGDSNLNRIIRRKYGIKS